MYWIAHVSRRGPSTARLVCFFFGEGNDDDEEMIEMDLGDAKRIFILTKKSENVSERTVAIYHEILNRFFNDLFEKQILKAEEVKANHIREFLLRLHDEGLKGVSVHRFYRGIKTFFLFLVGDGYLEENPIKAVKPPKIEKKDMRTFTSQEISRMLNVFNQEEFFDFRNYTIFCLLFSTGIRKSEMQNLKLSDVNITNDLIRIHGKGDKERFVPISRSFKKTFERYLKKREEFLSKFNKTTDFVFVTENNYSRLSTSCINRIFGVVKDKLGLEGEKISSHTWRHTFAKNYLLCGGDIFSLQKIMGHSNITTTKAYIALNDKELKMQHARFNPLDNKDWL